MALVQFKKGLYSNYAGLQTKDNGTLYFCTDTNQIFMGETEYTRPIIHGAGEPTARDAAASPRNTLYFDTTNKNLYVNLDGATTWTKVTDSSIAADLAALVTRVGSVESAIENMDLTEVGSASKTLKISQTNGKVSAEAVDIQIAESQVTGLTDALGKKADKVTGAVSGNFAGLDANGNLTDSGKKASDFAAAGDLTALEGRVGDLEGKPAAGITSTQITNWDNEVGAKAAAEAAQATADKAVVANEAITAGTHTKITYDAKGLVTAGEDLAASDIPNLDASKITTGQFADDRIASAATWNAKQDALNFITAYDPDTNKVATKADIAALEGAIHFKGTFGSLPTADDYAAGDLVIVGTKEYILSEQTGVKTWVELGDEGTHVQKTFTIAGIDMQDNIGKTELLAALNVEDGAEVNVIDAVDTGDFKIGADRTLEVADGKQMMTAAQATRLAEVTKVEASATNGNIKIDGTETKVYEAPAGTVVDGEYKHITVTESSVSDGTATFNKYVHPTQTAKDAAAVKVGNDGLGHVVIGDALTQDDIADGTTYVRVTPGEKTTWSGKQDALVFNTAYNAETNKVATMADIESASLTWGSF